MRIGFDVVMDGMLQTELPSNQQPATNNTNSTHENSNSPATSQQPAASRAQDEGVPGFCALRTARAAAAGRAHEPPGLPGRSWPSMGLGMASKMIAWFLSKDDLVPSIYTSRLKFRDVSLVRKN